MGRPARLACSSDWNVAETNPLAHLCAEVTRRGADGGAEWVPQQTIDLSVGGSEIAHER